MLTSLLFFSALSLIFSLFGYTILSIIFGWIALVQFLNRLAPHLPFSRSIHWAHAITFECLAILGVLFLRFFPFSQKIPGHSRPILLVHGYMNFASVWLFQIRWLKSLGLGPIYTINLGYPFQSIQVYAEKVKKKVLEIQEETGRKDLILIGHSMGGLVSLWYALKLKDVGSVTDLITIASPLKGTPMAHFGLGPNAKEMLPNSKLIQEIQEGIEKNENIRLHHIATKRDQLVIPGRSALIEDHNHFLFEDLGHASLLYSKRTSHKIYEWLRN